LDRAGSDTRTICTRTQRARRQVSEYLLYLLKAVASDSRTAACLGRFAADRSAFVASASPVRGQRGECAAGTFMGVLHRGQCGGGKETARFDQVLPA
jgi:hypothetical protein